MTSSYRDPNVTAALAYQAEQEQRRKAQEQPNLLDIAGRTALGLGAAALAGVGIRGLMRRNAVRPVSVEDLGATAARAEENVRRAARSTATLPPSRPAPPAGVARQQTAEEFTRQARAERPTGIQQVSIQDVVPTEEEFVAYRPDPKEMVSREVAEARRQAATSALLKASQSRQEPYQLSLGGEFSPTLRSIRSSEFGPNLTQVRERALGLLPAEAPSRPLDIAPNQLNIFNPRSYIEQTGSIEPTLTVRPAVKSAVDASDRFIQEYEQLAENQARADRRVKAGLREREMQIRGTGERVLAELQQESLVSKQQARAGFNVDQAINALDAAEDQQTGRVKIQLQRNEDLDLGQVEVLEDIASQQRNSMLEMDEPINRVAAQLPDGLPIDQAEGVRSLSSQELADIAKSEMITRRQEVAARGLIPGTLRFERALAEGWASKPGFMPGTEEFRQRIALPRVIRSAVQAASADPLDPLGGLKERTVVNIGPNAEISSTAGGTAIRGASPVYDIAEPKIATRQIFGTPDTLVPGAPDELMPDRPGIETAFQQIISQPQLPERIDPYAVKRLKGGSPGIGVYGPELSYVPGAVGKATGEYSAATSRTPGYVPAWILKQEQTPFSGVSTEGLNRALTKSGKSGTSAITSELGRREIAKENLVKSELLRRANIEGRDPQMILKQFGIGT